MQVSKGGLVVLNEGVMVPVKVDWTSSAGK